MDLFNRWLMRSSGEKRYQADGEVEKITFATFDYLRRREGSLDIFWGDETEAKKNLLMNEVLKVVIGSLFVEGGKSPENVALEIAYYLQGHQCIGDNQLNRARELVKIYRICVTG